MSLTKVGIVGKTAARFGVQEIPGRMSIPKVRKLCNFTTFKHHFNTFLLGLFVVTAWLI